MISIDTHVDIPFDFASPAYDMMKPGVRGQQVHIPTMIEGGVPGYDVTSWLAAYAPAGTPRPVIDKLNGWFNQILAMEDFKKAMAFINYDLYPGSPESLEKFHLAEIEKWGRLIRAAKIEPQ